MTEYKWPEVALSDVLRVKHGFAFKGEYFQPNGEQLVLTPGNFKIGGGLQQREGKERFYSGPYSPEYKLAPGDLLVAMTDLTQSSPILGSPLMIPSDGVFLHNQRLGKIEILDNERLDREFAYYLFVSDIVRGQLRGSATGSTVRHTAPGRIYSAKVRLPPLSAQRKIAAVLSAYDDLIDNNTRRIKLLEEMAQRIYREWFVDFHYPGYESVSLHDSELGPIPEGWAVEPLSSLTELIARGVSPTYADASDELVINQKCIRGGVLDLGLARQHVTAVPPTKMVRLGDVLINSTGVGTLGRVAQVLFTPASGLTVDSHVTIVRAAVAAADPDYLGLTLLEREPELATMGIGSTGQTELGRAAIGAIEVVVPPMPCQKEFSQTISSIRRLPIALAAMTATARAARDFLLPRLISGAVDVTDLDIAMAPEAA